MTTPICAVGCGTELRPSVDYVPVSHSVLSTFLRNLRKVCNVFPDRIEKSVDKTAGVKVKRVRGDR